MGFFQNTCKPEGLGGKLMVQMMNSGHGNMAKWGFSNIKVSDNANILDIGCGGGANINNWLKLCKKGHVTGIDYSEVSVEVSSNKNKKAILENSCDVFLGNVLELDFNDETFDVVSAFETIYFWPKIEKSFLQVYRVLKSGGKFIICNEFDGTNPKDEKWTNYIQGMTIYTEETLCNLLSSVGFHDLEVHHTKSNWICIIAKK